MKKMFSVLIIVALCLDLCACSSGTTSTKLTLDNYEQYLDVRAAAEIQDDYEGNSFLIGTYMGYDYFTSKYGQYIYGSVSVRGLSTNFNYTDIEIEVEITGKYRHCDLSAQEDENERTLRWDEFKIVTTCSNVDITGSGKSDGNDKFSLASGRGIPILQRASYVHLNYEETDFLEYTYKVVSVKGTVTAV